MELVEASQIKNGDCIILNNIPCKIVNCHHTVEGKHGAMKVHLTGIGIFNKKKINKIYKGADKLNKPQIIHQEGQIISIDEDDYLTILLNTGGQEYDVRIMEDVKERILDLYQKYSESQNQILYLTLLTCWEETWVTSHRVKDQ